jgi:hypothetical protein
VRFARPPEQRPAARERYLRMAKSWTLIAEHHEVLAELDGKAEHPK